MYQDHVSTNCHLLLKKTTGEDSNEHLLKVHASKVHIGLIWIQKGCVDAGIPSVIFALRGKENEQINYEVQHNVTIRIYQVP